ncbi:hypothetical protein MLD38_015247 [Melastoma candidum]|uniref:Uncharacterized protein n=1 Tax=Melastoma candidum TaxID=119954 RepID=A0ACB9RFB2_9MYRT|nr:hypothetical protein MLD38_015247 [Melastoma candidum]
MSTPGGSDPSRSLSFPTSTAATFSSYATEESVVPDEGMTIPMPYRGGGMIEEFSLDDEFGVTQSDDQPVVVFPEEVPARVATPDRLQQRHGTPDPVILVNAGGKPWRSGLFACFKDPISGYRGLSAEILRERSLQATQNTAPQIQTMKRGITLGHWKSTFTYEEIARATNGFSSDNLLGQGGFGYVYRGLLPNGKEIAVKRLKARSRQGEHEFQAEVEIISRIHHRHLVSLVGYCIHGNQRMLAYEFVPNNNLKIHLHGKSRPTMDWQTRVKIALGCAKGLSYLHEDCQPKIIHRDIKAANILLDSQFEAKVADFGLSKYMGDGHTHVSTGVKGTFGYISPEYASSGKLTEKVDVFSFGVVLLELITGLEPTNTNRDASLVEWVRPKLKKAIQDQNFDSLVDPRLQNMYNHGQMSRMVTCAAACVRYSAHRRPKMSQIVRILEEDAFVLDLTPIEENPQLQSSLYSAPGGSTSSSSVPNYEFGTT